MSETVSGSHWAWSCRINRCLGGRRGQPTCSRAWQNGWTLFIECLAVAFRDPCHCEAVHIRWLALQSYAPPPITGRTGGDAGY